MRKRIVIFLPILVMLAMACNLTTNAGTSPQVPGNTPQAGGNQPGGDQPGGAPQKVGTPSADPVSINEGLASLNSYQMTVLIKSIGPDPSQSSNTTIDVQHSKDADATLTHLIMEVIKKGETEPSNTDSNIYQIGNDQCSGSTDGWEWSTSTPAQTEMSDLVKNMIGFTPLIDNPTFVAQETVNGIQSNHFSFKISGLGVKSGAEVKTNQGDYWLAVDGQYIVKYTLIIETSMSADSEILHEEISIDLNQINQPVSIAFPQGCLDASKVTPTP
jgi:archaellum component FlaG (FlaF/FlaG flagellin family)